MMQGFWTFLTATHDDSTVIFFLVIAMLRIAMEIMHFDFLQLKISGQLAKHSSDGQVMNLHRMGLYFCIGYILLFAPGILFS